MQAYFFEQNDKLVRPAEYSRESLSQATLEDLSEIISVTGDFIDRNSVLHKTKLLLKIYRPVVWSTASRALTVCENSEYYCGKSLERALEYLANFAPETEQERFSEKVNSLFETQWLISLIDTAMNKIYEYPDNGRLYHEILSKQYLTVNKYAEHEMLELKAFYNNGEIKLKINDDDLFRSFNEFYSHGSNAKDLLKDQSTVGFRSWSKKEYVALARKNPLKYLAEAAPEFFYYEGEDFCLNKKLEPFINKTLFKRHFKDVIEYRTLRFYKERYQNKEK